MKIVICYITLGLLIGHLKINAQPDSLKGAQLYSSNFIIDGRDRVITYYFPKQYGEKEAYPLIIFLHADRSSSKEFINAYGEIIGKKADSANCIIMYPEAFSGNWNMMSDSVNDVGFVTIMINYFVEVHHVDAARIYMAGFGDGGLLALRFACEMGNKISAVASFIPEVNNLTPYYCNHQLTVDAMNTKIFTKAILLKPDSGVIEKVINFFLQRK